MRKKCKVSVLLPVFNGERFVNRAIDSVLNQSFKDFEFIIVNDGSTDHTAKILENYRYYRGVWIMNVNHRGLTQALTLALKCANGEYVTFISHDDFWLPYKLKREVKVMNECSKKIGVVYSNFYNFYEASRIAKPIFASPIARDKILDECCINISSAIIRRSTLDRLKRACGFILDPTLNDCVDWDLWIRLAQICHFKHIPQILTYYGVHRKQMSRNFSHGVYRWKIHLKWNGFKPRYFFNSVIRASLRNMLHRF